MRTLCIGIDIAWWGGGKRKACQTDHVWVGWIDATNRISEFEHLSVDLKDSLGIFPQCPNGLYGKDPWGKDLVRRLSILGERASVNDNIVIAIDAPLDAADRSDIRPRKPCCSRGEKSGAVQRGCEIELRGVLRQIDKSWQRDVRVQPGAPLFPRVRAIVEELERLGYHLGAAGRQKSNRLLVEIFPSASIGALGALGCYSPAVPDEVRRYKSIRRLQSLPLAEEAAKAPILGFRTLLGPQVDALAEMVATVAVEQLSWKAGNAVRPKQFDDVVDASIAFATGACLIVGQSRWVGDGNDGSILLPGRP